ncbi:MAG: kynureninase [Porticoccaceae bacterium]|jgi:kynureninase
MTELPTREAAQAMDLQDPFASKRDLFALENDVIYLCGNSLGPMPNKALADIKTSMKEDWAKGLISSQNTAGWWLMSDTLGNRVATLLGATQGEVVVSDSTSLNIYKTLHAALSMQPGRNTIVSEGESFPTDLYMIEGVTSLLSDMNIKLEGRDAANIEDLFNDDVAVVLLNQVDYRSGTIRDIKGLTAKAHACGALVISDVCHSAGVIPVNLHDENVDFAVGCMYKYLNGGPGAPSFVYAATRHHGNFKQPLTGWHGHAAPFKFEQGYRAADGARAFLTGTQPTLSQIAAGSGLDVFDGVNMHELYAKGKKLSTLFANLVDTWCSPYGVSFYSPRDADLRNGQVAFAHENGYAIIQALIARKVTGDFRQLNVMRFGITPLYLRFVDVWDAANHMHDVLESEEWKQDRFSRKNLVT